MAEAEKQPIPVLITTYSLKEVAEMVLPPDWKQPELWLMRRLRRREISGYKVGNTWRMRQSDVDALLSSQRPPTRAARDEHQADVLAGLSRRGRARLSVLDATVPAMDSSAQWAVTAANKFREVARTTENPNTRLFAEGLTALAEALRALSPQN